jgi:hypothetical protein
MRSSRGTIHKYFLPGFLFLLIQASAVTYAQQPAIDSRSAAHGGTPEDWTSLSLTGSDLRQEKPILGQKDATAQFNRELIRVQWRMSDPIDLYVILPKGVSKPPVTLYLYSYPSELDRFRDNDYCARISHDGYAAVGFVSALTGQRYANRPMKEWFVSELQESLATSVHDVQMVLNFLSTRDDLDMSRVGMFGSGSGGTIAILAAAADPRIKAIDVLDPWGDWPEWMASSSIIPENERPNYVKPEFLKKVAGLDPIDYLPKLKTQHIRVQQVFDDDVTPKNVKDHIASAVPAGATNVKYENTGQFFSAASGGRIFDWIKDSLRPAPAVGVQKSASAKTNVEPAHDE